MFGFIKKLFRGNPAKDDEAAHPVVLTEEQQSVKEQLEADIVSLNVLIRTVAKGERQEIHDKAITMMETLERIESTFKANPIFQVVDVSSAWELARKAFELSQPLHAKQSDDTTMVCIIDTETTGVSNEDEPISVAALLLEVTNKFGDVVREVDSYHGFREPSVAIDSRAYEVHGVSMDSLIGKDFDYCRLSRIINSADIMIAHNAAFDKRMLASVMTGVDGKTWVCSMNGLNWAWRDMTGGKKSLDAICETLGIAKAEQHDALGDVRALQQVLAVRTGKTTKSQTLLSRLLKTA